MVDPNDARRSHDAGSTRPTGDLAQRIARAKASRPADGGEGGAPKAEMTGMGRGFRLASEFAAAILVGAALGWGIDTVFGTTPWAMIVLLLLGFAAGVLNVIRAAAEMNAANPVPPGTAAVADDDDE